MADRYYNDTATVMPAVPPAPDAVVVVFGAALPSTDYTVTFGGHKVDGVIGAGSAVYNIKSEGSIMAGSRAVGGFTIEFTWTVYDALTNAWVGEWSNYTAMMAALGIGVVANLLHIDWQVRMYL